jgi:putative endopeptidase
VQIAKVLQANLDCNKESREAASCAVLARPSGQAQMFWVPWNYCAGLPSDKMIGVSMNRIVCRILMLLVFPIFTAQAQGPSPSSENAKPTLPYFPSLNPASLDRSADPCVNFYRYACGGWKQNNPIPADQTSWDVYSKLYQDNLIFLRGMLEQAAMAQEPRDAATQKTGDFYASCMDEAAVEKRGFVPLQTDLFAIEELKGAGELAALLARLQLVYGSSILFRGGSAQDLDDSEQISAELDQGGLGLPDRDYYTKEDDKSKEIRERYLQHVQKIFELSGEPAESAKKDAETILRIETLLAKASLTRVERRDPYKLKHKMNRAQLSELAPNFNWKAYYATAPYPAFQELNVQAPEFFKEVNSMLASEPVDTWKTYLRFQVVNSSAPYLSPAFVKEQFEFYTKYLRGAKEEPPRWKRCVSYTDRYLGEALGQVYVAKVFSPQMKQDTLDMTLRIEGVMEQRIRQLDWMSPATKEQALTKLHGIRNKIGYPDKWRDYSSLKIERGDFGGNIARANEFERRRRINKIGKPLDRGEWAMSPPTVNAEYDPQMNDINFPAGVLQPPLFDPKMDAGPNYGDTGGTIGHELTHGFDDEGSQFDANGNLRNWWTKEDRDKFDARTKCVADQYAQYVVVDDIKINSQLTLGEDVADLGGEILAYIAWQGATKDSKLEPRDGLTPEQRFFVGFAQWACANERPEQERMNATTDPHSPAEYRINGVVVNMPEFAQAFACKTGQPMTKPEGRVCKIW